MNIMAKNVWATPKQGLVLSVPMARQLIGGLGKHWAAWPYTRTDWIVCLHLLVESALAIEGTPAAQRISGLREADPIAGVEAVDAEYVSLTVHRALALLDDPTAKHRAVYFERRC